MADSDSTVSTPRRTRLINLTGQRFGRLLVTGRGQNSNGRVRWAYLCDCGQIGLASTGNLRSGGSLSCGCIRAERRVEVSTTHGMSITPEFRAWATMQQRCENPRNPRYRHYGGRGIRVCDRWQLFENFYADMGKRPTSKHSIDRIDNNGHYAPENCRWATNQEQLQNTRRNVYVELHGERMTVAEAARRSGLYVHTLYARLERGDCADRLFRPVERKPT
jgi:hypothetical protein